MSAWTAAVDANATTAARILFLHPIIRSPTHHSIQEYSDHYTTNDSIGQEKYPKLSKMTLIISIWAILDISYFPEAAYVLRAGGSIILSEVFLGAVSGVFCTAQRFLCLPAAGSANQSCGPEPDQPQDERGWDRGHDLCHQAYLIVAAAHG